MAIFKTYGDCPSHGEAIEAVFPHVLPSGERVNLCRLCADEGGRVIREDGAPSFVKVQMSNVRRIEIKSSVTREAPKCGGKCTSGKRACDCRCGGKCHGAGRCLGGHA